MPVGPQHRVDLFDLCCCHDHQELAFLISWGLLDMLKNEPRIRPNISFAQSRPCDQDNQSDHSRRPSIRPHIQVRTTYLKGMRALRQPCWRAAGQPRTVWQLPAQQGGPRRLPRHRLPRPPHYLPPPTLPAYSSWTTHITKPHYWIDSMHTPHALHTYRFLSCKSLSRHAYAVLLILAKDLRGRSKSCTCSAS
jgi:hypothetical protein